MEEIADRILGMKKMSSILRSNRSGDIVNGGSIFRFLVWIWAFSILIGGVDIVKHDGDDGDLQVSERQGLLGRESLFGRDSGITREDVDESTLYYDDVKRHISPEEKRMKEVIAEDRNGREKHGEDTSRMILGTDLKKSLARKKEKDLLLAKFNSTSATVSEDRDTTTLKSGEENSINDPYDIHKQSNDKEAYYYQSDEEYERRRKLQDLYQEKYVRCTGYMEHRDGNNYNFLDCQQRDQSEFLTYDGGTAWRVISRAPYRTIWSIFELQFLIGTSCNTSVAGNLAGQPNLPGKLATGIVPISSLSNAAGNTNGESYWAYDGREEYPELVIGGTGAERFGWQSQPSPTDYAGESWLGLDTRDAGPQSIQCVAIYQDPTPETWVTSFAVQRWTGLSWEDFFIVSESWSGNWCRQPRPLEHWRLLPTVEVSGPWKVSEFQLYSEADCGDVNAYDNGYVIASGSYFANDASYATVNANDGNAATAWWSNCPSTGCPPNSTWVGMDLGLWRQYNSFEVKCVRLLQEDNQGSNFEQPENKPRIEDYPRQIIVQQSTGSSWKDKFVMTNLWSGFELKRPTATNSLWRILATSELGGTFGLDAPGWHINDMEFHLESDCSLRINPIDPQNKINTLSELNIMDVTKIGMISDSKTRGDGDTAIKKVESAFDLDTTTIWRSDCAPCTTMDNPPWIGMDLGVSPSYYKDNAMEVKCVRILGGDNGDAAVLMMPKTLELQTWKETGDFSLPGLQKWETTLKLLDIWPTYWNQRPLQANQMWLFKNVDTPHRGERWRVQEFKLFSDYECNTEIPVSSVATNNYYVDPSADSVFVGEKRPFKILDNDPKTGWVSLKIQPGIGDGSDGPAAWLAFTLPYSVDVKCFYIMQLPGYGVRRYEFFPWDGTLFSVVPKSMCYSLVCPDEVVPLFDTAPVIPTTFPDKDPFAIIAPSLPGAQAPIDYVSAQQEEIVPDINKLRDVKVEDLFHYNQRPVPYNGLWAITNGIVISDDTWEIDELEFYKDEWCTVKVSGKTPISDSYYKNKEPAVAFDGGVGEEVSWQTGCRLRNGVGMANTKGQSRGSPYNFPLKKTDDVYDDHCKERTSWLGQDFGTDTVNVKCIRIYQGRNYAINKIHLVRWNSLGWEIMKTLTQMDGDTWIRRPAGARFQWRLKLGENISGKWAVRELKLYQESDCTDELIDLNTAVPMSKDRISISSYSQFAIDGALTNFWQARCLKDQGDLQGGPTTPTTGGGCLEGSTYIGVDLGIGFRGKHTIWGPQVGCLRLWQHEERGTFTNRALLEYWSEGAEDWLLHKKVGGLWGGSWNRRPVFERWVWRMVATKMNWELDKVNIVMSKLNTNTGFIDSSITNYRYGWAINETRWYTDTECTNQVVFDPPTKLSDDMKNPKDGQRKNTDIGSRFLPDPTAYEDPKSTDQPYGDLPYFERHLPRYLTDKNLATHWRSTIEMYGSSTNGIEWDEQGTFWHGVDFYQETDVRCIAIYQHPEGARVEQTKNEPIFFFGASGFDLQHWKGLNSGWGDYGEDVIINEDLMAVINNPALRTDRVAMQRAKAVKGAYGGARNLWEHNWYQTNQFRFGQVWSGFWAYRPAAFNQLWRFVHPEKPYSEWNMRDRSERVPNFYSDDLCSQQVFSSRPREETFADGDLRLGEEIMTLVNSVGTGPNVPTFEELVPPLEFGTGRGFLAVDFGRSVDVRCASLPMDRFSITYLRMEGWKGDIGSESVNYGFNYVSHFESLVPSLTNLRTAMPPVKSRVSNGDSPMLQWSIREVLWYSDPDCSDTSWIGRFRYKAISSSYRGTHDAEKAMDSDPDTAWWSSENKPPRKSAWVGLDLSDGPWGRAGANVRCIRLYQDPDQDKSCLEIILESSSGSGWYEIATFSPVGFGYWIQLPPLDNSIVRLKTAYNVTGLTDQWRVFEVKFFLDEECVVPAPGGVAISSRHRYQHPPPLGFDGDTSNYWEPDCEMDEWTECDAEGLFCQQRRACGAGKIWLGLDMSYLAGKMVGGTPPLENPWGSYKPVRKKIDWNIQCIRLLQDAKFTEILFEKWTGGSITGQWNPDRAFAGIEQRLWSQLPRTQGTKWRIASASPTVYGWGLKEVEFYRDMSCIQEITYDPGQYFIIDGGTQQAYPKTHVFDKNLETGWRSECQKCKDSEAWVGLSTVGTPFNVYCVRIWQWGGLGGADFGTQESFHLQRYSGVGTWENVFLFTDMPNSGWEQRAIGPNMYRWYPNVKTPTSFGWGIKELQLYHDTMCTELITKPKETTSRGHFGSYTPQKAFDGDENTEWRSRCLNCEIGEAWLQVKFQERSVRIQCIRLLQSSILEQETPFGGTQEQGTTSAGGGGALGALSDGASATPSSDGGTVTTNTPRILNNGLSNIVELFPGHAVKNIRTNPSLQSTKAKWEKFRYTYLTGGKAFAGEEWIKTTYESEHEDSDETNKKSKRPKPELKIPNPNPQMSEIDRLSRVTHWRERSSLDRDFGQRMDIPMSMNDRLEKQKERFSTSSNLIKSPVSDSTSNELLTPEETPYFSMSQEYAIMEEKRRKLQFSLDIDLSGVNLQDAVDKGYLVEADLGKPQTTTTLTPLTYLTNETNGTESTSSKDSGTNSAPIFDGSSVGDYYSQTGTLRPEIDIPIVMEYRDWTGKWVNYYPIFNVSNPWVDYDAYLAAKANQKVSGKTLKEIRESFSVGWTQYPPKPYRNMGYRLVNDAVIDGSWHVAEIGFYMDRACEYPVIDSKDVVNSLKTQQIEIISSGNQGYSANPAIHAFDGHLETYWRSQCTGCDVGEAYLGFVARVTPRFVKCVKVRQDPWLEGTTTEKVRLQKYDDQQNTWIDLDKSEYHFEWSGYKTVWRVTGLVERNFKWGVTEVEFHQDADCMVKPEDRGKGLAQDIIPIGTVYVTSNNWSDGKQAFDSSLDTQWDSFICQEGPEQKIESWFDVGGFYKEGCFNFIGLNFRDSTEIKCVRFVQNALETESVETATVQTWLGNKWRTVWVFPLIARGSFVRFPHDIPPPEEVPYIFPILEFMMYLGIGTCGCCCLGFFYAWVWDGRKRRQYRMQYKMHNDIHIEHFQSKAETLGWNAPEIKDGDPTVEDRMMLTNAPHAKKNADRILSIQDRIDQENYIRELKDMESIAREQDGTTPMIGSNNLLMLQDRSMTMEKTGENQFQLVLQGNDYLAKEFQRKRLELPENAYWDGQEAFGDQAPPEPPNPLEGMSRREKFWYLWYRTPFYGTFWNMRDYMHWVMGMDRVIWMDFELPEPEPEADLDESNPPLNGIERAKLYHRKFRDAWRHHGPAGTGGGPSGPGGGEQFGSGGQQLGGGGGSLSFDTGGSSSKGCCDSCLAGCLKGDRIRVFVKEPIAWLIRYTKYRIGLLKDSIREERRENYPTIRHYYGVFKSRVVDGVIVKYSMKVYWYFKTKIPQWWLACKLIWWSIKTSPARLWRYSHLPLEQQEEEWAQYKADWWDAWMALVIWCSPWLNPERRDTMNRYAAKISPSRNASRKEGSAKGLTIDTATIHPDAVREMNLEDLDFQPTTPMMRKMEEGGGDSDVDSVGDEDPSDTKSQVLNPMGSSTKESLKGKKSQRSSAGSTPGKKSTLSTGTTSVVKGNSLQQPDVSMMPDDAEYSDSDSAGDGGPVKKPVKATLKSKSKATGKSGKKSLQSEVTIKEDSSIPDSPDMGSPEDVYEKSKKIYDDVVAKSVKPKSTTMDMTRPDEEDLYLKEEVVVEKVMPLVPKAAMSADDTAVGAKTKGKAKGKAKAKGKKK